jgi:hypothetical protein
MKTSNKLLTAFFLFMPLLMLAADLLLRAQYVKGNMSKQVFNPGEAMVKQGLAPFRHVVFDGRLIFEQGNQQRERGSRQRLMVEVSPGNASYLLVHPKRKNMLEYNYRHDTLFISYRVKTLENHEFYAWYSYVTLVAPEISSVTGITGSVKLAPFRQQAPLALEIEQGCDVTTDSLRLPLLQLSMQAMGRLELFNAAIDSLAYNMAGGSELVVKRPYTINTLSPGKVDAGSLITLSGAGPDMDKIVPGRLGATTTTEPNQ